MSTRLHFFSLQALTTSLLLCATIFTYGQDLGETVNKEGLYSYEAPKDWTIKNDPATGIQLACDTQRNNFTANINVLVDSYSGPVADYVAKNMQAIIDSHIKILDVQPFKTTTGANGYRLVFNYVQLNTNLHSIQYYFEGSSNNKCVVTFTCLAEDGDHYAPIVDASLKTFTTK